MAQADWTNLGHHAARAGPVRGDVSEEKEAQRVPGQGLGLEFDSSMGTTKRGEVVPRSTRGSAPMRRSSGTCQRDHQVRHHVAGPAAQRSSGFPVAGDVTPLRRLMRDA